jgi:hypothetical protein
VLVAETTALKESLRKALSEYRREKAHLSLRAIAKNSGVNRYFLMKLLDENDTSTALDLSQVLLLAKFITQRESVREAIDSSSREVQEVLKRVFAVDYELVPEGKVNLFQQTDLYNPDNYLVLVLSTNSRGTKREYIQRILGERGEKALLELLAKGLIIESEGGRIHLAKGTDFTCTFDIYKHQIPSYLRYYSPQRANQSRNNLHVVSEGVNLQGLRKVHQLHIEFYKNLLEILIDKENTGDIPMFSFGCMDTFLENLHEENNESST